MATRGTAWLIRRSRDLVPALLGLAVREWLTEAAEPSTTARARTVAGGNPRT